MSVAEPLFKATVAYDGTDFCGFQLQTGQRTVQGVLEQSLASITQTTIRVIGAGRTDSGVHAWGQVVAFQSLWKHSVDELLRGWNALLPCDVVARSLAQVEAPFHPRFDAKSRTYRYSIWNDPVRHPLLHRTTAWVPQHLDVERMHQAASCLVGTHDFATFGQPPQGDNTVRCVFQSACTQADEVVFFDIRANAFLYRMVRSIVGTLIQVGRGDLSVEQFADLFAAMDRRQAGPTAPAQGLCLMAVHY